MAPQDVETSVVQNYLQGSCHILTIATLEPALIGNWPPRVHGC